MIPRDMIALGSEGNIIRALNEIGAEHAAVIGEENVYNFTIGNPSIAPPDCIHNSIRQLMETMDAAKLHSYTAAPGLPSTRAAMAAYLNRSFGMDYTADNIYMTHGASAALATLCKALLNPGEQMMTATPCYPEYRTYVEAFGGQFIEVPSDMDSFQLDIAGFETSITEKTKAVILNSPNNPSGAVLSEETLKAFAAMLEEKQAQYGHAIYIIADEPYRELVYGGAHVPFIPTLYRNTIYCYSFSKSVSLPGERIGFIAVPPALDEYSDVFAAICGASRALGYVCVSALFQRVIEECIGQTSDISVYEKNRDLLYEELGRLGYEFVNPNGAFYIFIKTFDPDDMAFCKRALDFELLLVPGSGFGCPGYARIAYCVGEDVIRRSLPTFAKLAAAYGIK